MCVIVCVHVLQMCVRMCVCVSEQGNECVCEKECRLNETVPCVYL